MPRCISPPPLESLDQAKIRAQLMALWTLPLHPSKATHIRAANRAGLVTHNSAAMFQRDTWPLDLLGGHAFPSAPTLQSN